MEPAVPACDVSELHSKMLERAVEIVGGPRELAEYLGVSPLHLRIWMLGMFDVPDEVFLKLVDLISEAPLPGPGEPRHGKRA